MNQQVDLDDEVFEYLKSKAEPFVDTPNSVLRRLLGIDGRGRPTAKATHASQPTESNGKRAAAPIADKKRNGKAAPAKRTRAPSGSLLPEERYERPLLKALVDAGGQAAYRDVVEAVGRELEHQLMPADLENLNSGAVRWRSRLQFVRLRLIERGYLDKNAPRGLWGITDAGRAVLENEEEA